MGLSKQKLKSRINSINTTKKITKAMQLIAQVKLQKQRMHMEKNREYSNILKSTVNEIISRNKHSENKFLQEKSATAKLTFLFSSDMGLCGGYNSNMLKLVDTVIRKDDPIIVIGRKQRSWLISRGYNILNNEISSDNIDYETLKSFGNLGIEKYLNNEISGIQVLYTEFVNTVTFEPKLETLLPCIELGEKKYRAYNVEILFEPDENSILDELIPMMIHNVLYSTWIQTKTAEQGSRRLAMESATDNAEELSEKLLLKYNQARQAAITQEITEIVSGADAL
ncbi:MAG: ATP synthase F1 subunit gamma [Erysipelotrichaceae bacterium]|nr:ATP synthase F1 subunit gamma [Erysipelotrichaceae bacterium]